MRLRRRRLPPDEIPTMNERAGDPALLSIRRVSRP